MTNAFRRGLRNYALYAFAWTVLGLFLFSQALAQKLIVGEPTPWWHYLLAWLIGVNLWALLTPPILWLGRRLPIERRNWLRRILLHVIFSILISFGQLAGEAALLSHLGVFPTIFKGFVPTFVFLLTIGFHQGILSYFLLLMIQYGVDYYRRYQARTQQALRLELRMSEMKAQLVDAQLSALKMQLQPHFLFNTLNAIMVLVRQQKGCEAERMLASLSDLLRCVLDDVDAQEIPLHRELEYLRLYLAIEQVRFPDRLRAEISADASILEAAVPQMSLQPIVENAIRHGLGKHSDAGKILVTANRVEENLEIAVRDDGPGFSSETPTEDWGIGLANIRKRLQQLYGDHAELNIGDGPGGGALVTIILPYHPVAHTSTKDAIEIHALQNADR
jgi:signal transduction histidine kinase